MSRDTPPPVQKTQPQPASAGKPKGKPVDIPIPTRADVERDLRKLIAPARRSGAGGAKK